MIFADLNEFINFTKEAVTITKKDIKVKNASVLKDKILDVIVYNTCLNENKDIKDSCKFLIWQLALLTGVYPYSIQGLYEAKGRGIFKNATVPAVNIRGLTYDTARALIRAAMKNNSKSFIFEIAKSEISYTKQRPSEYVSVCLAAAIKEDYKGPLFIQGDHFQINAKKYAADAIKEIKLLKELIEEAIEAGFFNIDIDTSTLVDLTKKDKYEEQRLNFELAANFTTFIREKQPKGIEVSVGGEIGEVGKQNSTPEELDAFMKGYRDTLKTNLKGISKISVQTGTSHGGVVLPDGSIAEVQLDFDTLKTLSKIAKEKFGLAGAVQHGASTLPEEAFHRFPEVDTAEVHLATGFQNMLYESKSFPKELKDKMYEWLKKECQDEKEEGQTEEQFIYKTRKRGFGPFKKEIFDLGEGIKSALRHELEDKFDFLFKKLNAINSAEIVDRHIKPVGVPSKEMPQALHSLLPH